MGGETQDALVRRIARQLADAGVQTPMLDARLLVRFALQSDDAAMISGGATPLTMQKVQIIENLASRRLEGEPVSRIVGERQFWGLSFALSPDTLDPRADTETLVAAALKRANEGAGALNGRTLRILDMGTGSGCILISLLNELPHATGIGTDISEDALAVARRNAFENGVAERAAFLCGSWYDAVKDCAPFDMIVSNPPYIPDEDIEALDPDVRLYDPRRALSGGTDGFDCYKIILNDLKKHLACDGSALLEIGKGQEDDMSRLAYDSGMRVRDSYRDLTGTIRVLEIVHEKSN